MLVSHIGDSFGLFQQVSAIDGKIAALKGSLQSVNVTINGAVQGMSAAEAIAPALISFYTNKRAMCMATLISRGFEDG